MATNASVEGEATSVFLEQEIRPLGAGVLAGLPCGAPLSTHLTIVATWSSDNDGSLRKP